MARRIIAPGRSCLECRRRKIKCDRQFPCAYCVRTRVRCAYPLRDTRQPPNKRKPPPTSQTSPNPTDNTSQISPPVTRPERTRTFVPLSLAELEISPLPAYHIPLLWQTYLDIVDPLLKILHVPTIQRQILSIGHNSTPLHPSMECLFHAICYSAVVAMDPLKCQQALKEQKAVVLKKYRAHIEECLTRGDFMRSHRVELLQAFTLYLTCGRRDANGPDVCGLMSTLIGNAMRLGLQCCETMPGLSPFQVEMHRRLWWHIVTLDVRVAEDNRLDPVIIEPTFTTQLPLNINDSSLSPYMLKAPEHQQDRTEMCFSLIRLRISNCTRRLLFSDEFAKLNGYPVLLMEQKCQMLHNMENCVEAQYLSQCDEGVPFDVVTVMATRLIIDKLKLVARRPMYEHHHGRDLINSERRMICLGFVQCASKLRRYQAGKQWQWLFQSYIEWDALAYLLLELCLMPSLDQNGGMWATVEDAINDWKQDTQACQDRRWQHIEDLYSNALAVKNGLISLESSPIETIATFDHADIHIRQPESHNPPDTDVGTSHAQTSPLEHPTAGTACEWSSSIFERYWEVAGVANQGPIS